MKTYKIILFTLSVLIFSGCKDFLDLKPLENVSEATYFKTLNDFQYAANNLHANVFAFQTNGLATQNNVYPINFDWGTDINPAANAEVSGTIGTPTADVYWQQTYTWLRPVNQLIAKAKNYTNQTEIAGPVGQAYFFRAWHHFFLLKRFGGVPIATEAADLNSPLVWGTRASRYEVVMQILNDLDTAIVKLANTTKASTNNDGHITLEAAKSFKARVCLFEGTWDKYVNGRTDGDGVTSGAGSNKPIGYPSVTDMLTMAKSLSKDIIDGGKFSLWKGVEDVSSNSAIKNPNMYKHSSYYYLFNLEDNTSNPAALSKSSNNEAIFRSIYDYTNRKSNTNLTHTWPASMTRKLVDMYLCTDGLPVNLSPLFQGYTNLGSEFVNRDYRLTACVPVDMNWYWGYGMYSTGAQYGVDITTLAASTYRSIPNLRTFGGSSYGSRKYRTEMATRKDAEESMDYMHIRLAEVYLIYAEATCELGDGQITDADLDYSINIVRARGGVAPLNAALIATAAGLGGQLTLLGEIRRERALELYGEGQRLSDLCRWGIAEAELAGQPRCGVYLSYNGTDSYLKTLINPVDNKPVYSASAFPSGTILTQDLPSFSYAGLVPTKAGCVINELATNRLFALKNYLQAIPTDQIKLNSKLVQNPSW
jgi:starch-binding outer membrane protein, SusD/RagB family